ncbi:MAG: 3-oxoacyl-[acyl-carrier-protein] reductase [Myxococcales bacterium]|nr:3-oxoacyl-[acyl-carrier-protein] reductase [Myxococcales bacterium]
MFDLNGKIALVTGGSRGIGRAVAEALAERGAHVVVGYVRGEDQAREVVAGIAARGGKAELVGFDVSDMTRAEEAVTGIAKRLGRLDILVANAGIAIDALLLRVKEEDIDQVFSVNVKGALGCARGAIKAMMRARYGRVIFLSSVVGETGNAGQAAYSASKAAIIGLSKTLAREYASRNVTVNAVAPGFIDTDMTRAISDAARAELLKGIPLGRVGSGADVAAAVVYLASDEAAYVTGQVLRVNGGMYA